MGEDKLFPGQPKCFPFGDFDVEDVMLPEGDDMGIPSDESDTEPEVQAETGFGAVIGECARPVLFRVGVRGRGEGAPVAGRWQ
jgi:hypothetical protein